MKILVLGATGFIGSRLVQVLEAADAHEVVRASRRDTGISSVRVDVLDVASLQAALEGMDCVVNCVAGSAEALSVGTRRLVDAALLAGMPRIVHLSSMAVYDTASEVLREDSRLASEQGWYVRAKCEAEAHLATYVRAGGAAVVFRPGCVAGPGGEVWTGRIARWLRAGRLGEIGAAGDGWSNLVHVDDVCQAIGFAAKLAKPDGGMAVYNMAAPDAPRWGEYFVDMAVAIGATPVKALSARQLKLDALLLGAPLKVLSKVPRLGAKLPEAMPPSLLRLWADMPRLDSGASAELGVVWTPYRKLVEDGARWFATHER